MSVDDQSSSQVISWVIEQVNQVIEQVNQVIAVVSPSAENQSHDRHYCLASPQVIEQVNRPMIESMNWPMIEQVIQAVAWV